MDKKFTRSIDSLANIFEFTEGFFEAEALDGAHLFAVNFAVEELFTNMVKYSTESTADILLSMERDDGEIIVRLTDFDVEPFDVTKAPPADVDSPLEDREPGGLGLHLVPKIVDTIDYEYVDRESRITFSKRLG